MKQTCEVKDCRWFNPLVEGCTKGLLQDEEQKTKPCDLYKKDIEEQLLNEV